MKALKRIASTLLAVMLLAAMLTVPVTAAGEYSITITGTDHTYEAYQIFSGTYNPSDSVLTNVGWGSGIDPTDILVDLKADATIGALFAGANNAAQVAGVLEGKSGTVVDAFAKVVAANLSATTSGTGAKSGSDYKISDLDEGYYIVIDKGAVGIGDGYSKHIVHVVGNVTVSPKVAVPTLEKTISRDKITYTKGVSTSFGDTVAFQLNAKLHERISDFDKYYMEFNDTLPAGLSFVSGSIKVYIRTAGTEIEVPSNYYDTSATSGQNLVVKIDDIKTTISAVANNAPAVADDHVIVKYDTTLNQSAVIGGAGNMNTAFLKYTSNPNDPTAYTTTASTTTDNAYVYTYKLILHKVDGANETQNLEGASFKLSRATSTGFEFAIIDPTSRNITRWDTEDKASVLTTDGNGLVTVNGLASATTYYLKETAAPQSYNPIEETIRVAISATGTTDGKLDTLTATTAYGGSSVEEIDKIDGSITVKIPNVKGTVLPSTGGMGTTLFYIVGAGLMLSAAGVMLAKKRFAQG